MGMTGAGAISQESLTGDGYVEFTVPGTRTQKVIGLGGPDMGATDVDVEYWLYITPIGNLSGNLGGGTYAPGDVFRIELSGGMLRSTKNGTDLQSIAAPQTPLFLDTWLASPGAAVSDAKIAMGTRAPMPVTWANPIGVSEGLTFTHVWDSTSVEDGAHTFTARVTDVGGNVVESSALMKTVDNTLPTCTLDSPSQGATVSGTVQVMGTATDANLFTLAFFVDSTLLSQHDGQTQASTMWNTTTIANGTHTVRSQSYDHGGGTSLPCEVTVTVNN
jgi:hypothetical protein